MRTLQDEIEDIIQIGNLSAICNIKNNTTILKEKLDALKNGKYIWI